MADASKVKTTNHDIVALHSRIIRMAIELNKSQSSNRSGFNPFDIDRLGQYTKEFKSKIAWIQDQPLLDLPESNPKYWELELFPKFVDVENDDINDIIRMLELLATELLNSASARDSARLGEFDYKRCLAIINKIESYVANHIAQATPIDLPESSPRDPISGPGKTGI